MASEETVLHRPGTYVLENRGGMVGDLVFALAWVTLVNVISRLVEEPNWAHYLFMVAGVLAYFGFVFSAPAALEAESAGE